MRYFCFLMLISMPLFGFNFTTIKGKVTFESKGQANVHILCVDQATNKTQSFQSNHSGFFYLTGLNPQGQYRFTFIHQGFQTQVLENVQPNTVKELHIILKLITVDEELQVTHDSRPQGATLHYNFTSEALETLPSNREISTIFEQLPGTADGVSFWGGASVDNVFRLDGGEASDPDNRLWDTPINIDAIESVSVSTGGVSAEFRGAQGGYVDVRLKSGSNQFEGNLRFIKSKISWNKLNKFDQEIGEDEDRIAFTFGGPILKDRIWFFSAFESRDRGRIHHYYPTLEAWQSYDRRNTVDDPNRIEGYYGLAKFTFNLTKNQDASLNINRSPMNHPIFIEANIGNRDMAHIEHVTKNYLGNWSWHKNQWLNLSLHLQYKDRPYDLVEDITTDNRNPLQTIYTGQDNYHPQHTGSLAHKSYKEYTRIVKLTNKSHHQWNNVGLTLSYGGEFAKKRTEFGWTLSNWVFWNLTDGSALFADYDDPNPMEQSREDYAALFLQSQWSIADHWQVNLGLRSEKFLQENANDQPIVDSGFDQLISPRLSVKFQRGKLDLSASITREQGLTYNFAAWKSSEHLFSRDLYRLIYNISDFEAQGLQPWENSQDWAQINPQDHPELWTPMETSFHQDSVIPVIDTLEVPYTDAFNLNFGYQFTPKYQFNMNLMSRHWYDSYEDEDLNHDGIASLVHFDDTWRKYQAVNLNLKKRKANDPFEFQLSYTFSKSRGFAQWGHLSYYQDSQYQIHNFRNGRLGEVPHVAKLRGSYQFPFGLSIGTSTIWRSGNRWTPIVQVRDLLPGSARYNQWINTNYEGQGSRAVDDFTRTNLNLTYKYKFSNGMQTSISLDIANLLNQQPVTSVYRFLGRGHYATEAEPGTQAWLDYVHNNAPVVDTEFSRFLQPLSYANPRSFFANIALQF